MVMVVTSVLNGNGIRNGKHISIGCMQEFIILSKFALDTYQMILIGVSAYNDYLQFPVKQR